MLSSKLKFLHVFWKSDDQDDFETPTDITVEFKLSYGNLQIGTLSLSNGIWSFIYSNEFKEQDSIKPLPDFPDVENVYKSSELYPFFALRIPGSGQLKAKGYRSEKGKQDTVELLKLFGHRTIANPFLLKIAV
ncbi:MAG: HipA N-terminal domain-containing protein [Bacteroidota bacterium]